MNALKTNNIITWQNVESAKPSFHAQACYVFFSGNIMNLDGKQDNEYPIKS